MKKSRLNLPHNKLLIAYGLANGHSQRQMAKELNTSQPAISRTAKRDDVRELIKKEEAKLFEQIKKILEEIQNDPIFLAKYQKKLEKELLNFKWLS